MKKTFLYITAMIIIVFTCIITVSASEIEQLEFNDEPYVIVNNNIPYFSDEEKTNVFPYEKYGDLDKLGRCTIAEACIGKELMPTEERGKIGYIKPSGWHSVKYDIVDGKYLYNRCHLIGYQLTAENANTNNLITGTRFLNINGMLPFENMVADYITETNNHVIYRVTPEFCGNDLLAKGVLIEAYSIEDRGEGICFNVYCFNAQPGITIDYATGESRLYDESQTDNFQNATTSELPNIELNEIIQENQTDDNEEPADAKISIVILIVLVIIILSKANKK